MKSQNKLSKMITNSIIITGITAFAASSVFAHPHDKTNGKTNHETAVTTTAKHTSDTKMHKVSYTIGYNIGKSFKENGININQTQFNNGLEAGISGAKPTLTDTQMKAVMMSFKQEMMAKAQAKTKSQGAKNLTASTAYITKVANDPGVKMIEKGLYYKVITAGKGPMPTATDTVTVNYEGKLINGTVFDSSYKRGKPTEFKVNQVIPGWTKALEQMPVGSTWMLYIAPNLAYGEMAPPSIGANQALIFKVDLIKISKAK